MSEQINQSYSKFPSFSGLKDSSHAVQFYEGDEYLLASVNEFLAEGLQKGEAGLAIIESHRIEPLKKSLQASGINVSEALEEKRLVLLDARQVLSKILVNDQIDSLLFKTVVSEVIGPLQDRFGKINAFGEMVNILWLKGNAEATLQLEKEWNKLSSNYRFSLLCGYQLGKGKNEQSTKFLEDICSSHEMTIPAENFSQLTTSEDQRREIAVLQHKSKVLEVQQRLLKEREFQLSDFVENAPVSLHWVDSNGTIVWANAAELEMLGYSKEEYIGHSISEFHADQHTIDDILKRLMGGETLQNYEARLKRKDGSIRTVLISSNVYRENDVFIHTRCFTRDVSDRVAAQELVKKHSEELARSNEELERFANIASHDLKEPLRTVQLYASLLSKKYEPLFDEDAKEYMGFIVNGANRMHDLVSDLFTLSTVDSHKAPPELIDFNALVEEVKTNLGVTLAETGAVIKFESLPRVLGSHTQFSQLIQNLLSNSIKFRNGRIPEINISAKKISGAYQFQVSDNGIGIEEKYFTRVFDLFRRFHDSDLYPGTGLGLALCKKIVERHKGKIWLDSKVGEGTTFYFTLPAR